MVGFSFHDKGQSVIVRTIVECGVGLFGVAVKHFEGFGVELFVSLCDEPDAVVIFVIVDKLVSSVCEVGVVHHVGVNHGSLHKL